MSRAGVPLGPPAVAAPSPWNLPNGLTVLRILLVPVFGWLLLREGGGDPALRWWAAGVFAVAMATDRIDGDIARARGLVTNFGKIADPIADKALTGMAFVGLSVVGSVPWWVTLVVLVREWGVTALRFFIIRHGVMPAGRGGKLKTALQTAALVLLVLPLWTVPLASVWEWTANVVLGLAVLVTVVTGFDYVAKAMEVRRGSARTAARTAARLAVRESQLASGDAQPAARGGARDSTHAPVHEPPPTEGEGGPRRPGGGTS